MSLDCQNSEASDETQLLDCQNSEASEETQLLDCYNSEASDETQLLDCQNLEASDVTQLLDWQKSEASDGTQLLDCHYSKASDETQLSPNAIQHLSHFQRNTSKLNSPHLSTFKLAIFKGANKSCFEVWVDVSYVAACQENQSEEIISVHFPLR
jgi:hypothetical protein